MIAINQCKFGFYSIKDILFPCMNATPTLISIIIPTYNRPGLLKETLDSIVSQTYQNWECILIDDGSTEECVKVFENFSKSDHRIKFLRRKDFITVKGANACRNIGINHANGDYLIFMDSDDLLLPFCLQERIVCFQENPEFDFIVFQVKTFSSKEGYVSSNMTKYHKDYLHAFLSHSIPWQTMAPMFHASFIKASPRFDLKMPRLQDPDFYTALLLQNNVKYKVLCNSTADSLYRQGVNKINVFNGLTGFYLYINKYSQISKLVIPPNKLRKCLTACYFQSYSYFNIFYKNKSWKEKKMMLKLTVFSFSKRYINLRSFISIMISILKR